MLSRKFDVVEQALLIAGSTFSLLKVRDSNKLVDAIVPGDFAADERLPYWADVWTSSVELARWCLADTDLRGKRVLELGSGLGLAGIAAARAGAIVTLSDYEQDALDFAQCNVLRNLSSHELERTHFHLLDWRNVADLRLFDPAFDMVIAADVVYERRSFLPLVEALHHLLGHRGVAVFTEPCRSIGELFFTLLQSEGFRLTTSECTVCLGDKVTGVKRVTIAPRVAE